MKNKIRVLLYLLACLFLAGFKNTSYFEPIAVIELFSSQGCSSCPPADQLLSKTITEVYTSNRKIFALSFHVDYWNRLGWKDPFSDKKFSERQNAYANSLKLHSNYTPQMIVNGTTEFVGSNESALNKALKENLSVKSEVAFKSLVLSFDDKKIPAVSYDLEGNFAFCKINVALISLSEVTVVKRGENSGATLINQNVVRQLLSADAKEKGRIQFEPAPVPESHNMAIIAFIQQKQSLKIIGAAQAKINN